MIWSEMYDNYNILESTLSSRFDIEPEEYDEEKEKHKNEFNETMLPLFIRN